MTLRYPLVATLCAAGLLTAAGVASAGWPTWGHDATHSMRADQPLQTPLAVLWKFTGAPPERGKGGNKGGVVIDGENLYFASKNILYAVDADSGELKWQMPEANSDGELSHPNITSAPGVGNGQVFIGDQSGTLTAHNAVDGNIDWEVTFKNPVRTPPLVIGQILYVGCDDDNLRAYDISQKNQPKLKWRLPIGDDVQAPLSYYGGMLYVVSQDMRVWCINADTGTVRWVRRTVQPVVNTAPVVNGTQLFVAAGNAMATYRLGNGDGRSYTLNDLQVDISGPPIITDTSWYFGDKNGWFYSFDKSTKLNWKIQLDGVALGAPALSPAPQTAGGKQLIFVGTNKGFVSAIDSKTGSVEWRYRLEPPKGMPQVVSYYPIQSPLAIDRNKIYVLSDDGALTCLSPGATDSEGPVVTFPKPTRGGEVNGSPPILFSVYLFDEGSGVDTRTIYMEIDGQPVLADEARYDTRTSVKRKGYVYDPVKRTLTYTFQTDTNDAEPGGVSADRRLAAGRHSAKVEATDYAGNHTEFTWSFIADPSLPKPAVAQARRRSQQLQGAGAQGGSDSGGTSAGISNPGQPAGVQPGMPQGVYGQRTGARGGGRGRFIRAPGYGGQPGQPYGPGAYPQGYPGGQPGVYPGGAPQGPYGPGVPR